MVWFGPWKEHIHNTCIQHRHIYNIQPICKINIPFLVKYFMLSEITALLSCESKKEKVEKSCTSNGTAKCKTGYVRCKKEK